MKSLNVHAILSELHKLLSNYSAEDFIRARDYRGTSVNLRDALTALASEARHDFGKSTVRPTPIAQSPQSAQKSPKTSTPGLTAISEIANALRNSDRFTTTSSILEYARSVGLNFQVHPKESRERLSRRLAEAISLAKEPKRSQIFSDFGIEVDNQTQGWIDVIKSRRS